MGGCGWRKLDAGGRRPGHGRGLAVVQGDHERGMRFERSDAGEQTSGRRGVKGLGGLVQKKGICPPEQALRDAEGAQYLLARLDGRGHGGDVALTGALGLEQSLLLEAISGGPLDAPWATSKGRAMLARRFTPGFALRLALKDAHLALEAGQACGLELPLTDALARRWELAMTAHADDDIASVIDAAS